MTESLLKKYDIPIDHLDFDYIKTCQNVKEIERIYTILKSGEEGYYPDLTNCALAKLKSLNPKSRTLREEAPLLNKQSMNKEEWKNVSSNISDWTETMKKNTEILREETAADEHSDVHPIRQFTKNSSNEEQSTQPTNIQRVKSCDYAQWDKYDPEVEMLKMDLNDERQCETVKMKNRKNVATIVDTTKTQALAKKLSAIEKQDLANKHRIKGNEFYKAADYDEALREYTLAIEIFPTASAFNNRAITYLKMNNLEMAIADCDQCLQLEPANVKALLRKAQALLNMSKYIEAYDVCMKILSIESNNEWATAKITEIKQKVPFLPPTNAFRMNIVEDEVELPTAQRDVTKKISSNAPGPISTTPPEDDFASLIIPNKIYPSKLSKLKSNFVLNKTVSEKKKPETKKIAANCKSEVGLIMPVNNTPAKSKITEYRNGVIIEEL